MTRNLPFNFLLNHHHPLLLSYSSNMPEPNTKERCSWLVCDKPGKLRCTRCRDATPQTLYCSAKCQKNDWIFHKAYCGKKAYTFDITLVASSSPAITRTVAIPAWFTFRQLHYTLQYAMGPWQHTHMHEFSFNRLLSEFESPTQPGYWVRNEVDRGPHRLDTLAGRDERLKVGPAELYDDDKLDNWHPMLGRPPKKVPKEREKTLRLEVFDVNGRLYETVAKDGDMYPLIYTYDFGDNWEHELIFKGETLARAARPLFSFAQGCGPVEDCPRAGTK
ncbi:unnamed protein product [Cyclocybe aegerita]|uniref:MYND-type domain-containing protein n=1 Tax=Cyclocybe aegerita TaxID=1973307 RepID=A0A8S0WG60_CYCAE|nr:unnamed protein product [Cyclocybe aegerita]